MKISVTLTLILISLLLLGCSGAGPAAADQATSAPSAGSNSALSEDYADALSVRNQLTLGILRLEGDPGLAITPEQAVQLLPLWQALRSLTGSGTAATAEVDALLAQIEGELSAAQVEAIAGMQLTRADLQTVAREWGIATNANGSGQPGSGAAMSESERATRQAERAASGEAAGGASTALLDRLVQLLSERAG